MKKITAIGLIAAMTVACGQKKTEAALAIQRLEMEKKQLRDSINIINTYKQQELEQQQELAAQKRTYATQSTTETAYSVSEKKKLNNKLKGTLIGTGIGALTGAAVSKDHKGKGALIGGVVGAGVGLGTGAVLDKREKDKKKK